MDLRISAALCRTKAFLHKLRYENIICNYHL